jgi:hypothetical protein
MKTKKYVIAIALFGGMLLTAYAANKANDNGTETAKVERSKIRIPTNG